MSFWDMMRISESGLNAQRLRLDIISNNIANIETTRTKEGGPYQRQDVTFSAEEQSSFLPAFVLARRQQQTGGPVTNQGVTVNSIYTDTTPGAKVYDPTNPDADKEGFVELPNVNLVYEMTNMMSATRSYEANMTVIDASRRMALRALDIGK